MVDVMNMRRSFSLDEHIWFFSLLSLLLFKASTAGLPNADLMDSNINIQIAIHNTMTHGNLGSVRQCSPIIGIASPDQSGDKSNG